MAKITGNYETMMVYSLAQGEEAMKAVQEKFAKLIEENASDIETTEWGKRKLAYLINDEADGFYVLYKFTAKTDFPAELERVVKITDGVLRSMVIAVNN